MSNSVYIFAKPFPSVEVIDGHLTKIVTERFPAFTVARVPDGWIMAHKTETDLCFNLWLDKWGKRPAIQIPHKHCYGFMWWVEYEIRERLVGVLGGTQFDEGIGPTKNCDKFYGIYSDYLRDVYGDMVDSWAAMARLECGGLPSDVLELMGDLV